MRECVNCGSRSIGMETEWSLGRAWHKCLDCGHEERAPQEKTTVLRSRGPYTRPTALLETDDETYEAFKKTCHEQSITMTQGLKEALTAWTQKGGVNAGSESTQRTAG